MVSCGAISPHCCRPDFRCLVRAVPAQAPKLVPPCAMYRFTDPAKHQPFESGYCQSHKIQAAMYAHAAHHQRWPVLPELAVVKQHIKWADIQL